MLVRVLPYKRKSTTTQVPEQPISDAHRRAGGNPYTEGACNGKHLEQINQIGKVLNLTMVGDQAPETRKLG
jgi:hypothetical protein